MPSKSLKKSLPEQSLGGELVQVTGSAPEIPFNREDAFYPLRRNPETGNIVPSYSWRECEKRFIWCTQWGQKIIFFEDLSWFEANGFGLKKRQRPK